MFGEHSPIYNDDFNTDSLKRSKSSGAMLKEVNAFNLDDGSPKKKRRSRKKSQDGGSPKHSSSLSRLSPTKRKKKKKKKKLHEKKVDILKKHQYEDVVVGSRPFWLVKLYVNHYLKLLLFFLIFYIYIIFVLFRYNLIEI
jgi:hypothetical protein